jgi:antitoxin (DNA-binding transcriptional repressor) of toxin-antitoxin stability system
VIVRGDSGGRFFPVERIRKGFSGLAAPTVAKCPALIDEVHSTGQPVFIRKRGKIVAKLVREDDPVDKPWLQLRGMGGASMAPFAAAVSARVHGLPGPGAASSSPPEAVGHWERPDQ